MSISAIQADLLTLTMLTFFGAGLVKGVSGMGLPTLAMGVLGAAISPVAAASLLIVPSFVTNIWQLASGPGLGMLLRRLWPMLLAIFFATLPGGSLLASAATLATTVALGSALIVYSLYTLFARQIAVQRRSEVWLSPLIGGVTGLVAGATGVFVIPAVPYLQALGLSRDHLVQALGMSFTVSTIALAVGLGLHGALRPENLALSVLAVAPALAGMAVGQILRTRISQDRFRRGFLICLMLLGAEMCIRPIL